jgi:uncharacterized protein YciI
MYAIILIRYQAPLADIAAATPDHRAYLASLHEQGILLASGPFDPRTGGMLLLRLPNHDLKELEAVRDSDPFWQRGLAGYELQFWGPTLGLAKLDAP